MGKYPVPPMLGRRASTLNEREKKEDKWEELRRRKESGQRARLPTPTREIDALIEDEEQNGKEKIEEKERNNERNPNSGTLNHLVAFYDPHGSYGGVIPKPPTHRRNCWRTWEEF